MEAFTQNKSAATIDQIVQVVSFKVNGEEYGVDILKVQEINRTMDVTRVPNSRDHIDGVINLRGKVIPVIDLRSCFGFQRKEHDHNTRIIVVELADKIVGFVVDQVLKVLSIPYSVIEDTPPALGTTQSDYIRSVAKFEDRLIILLDPERLLSESFSDTMAESLS